MLGGYWAQNVAAQTFEFKTYFDKAVGSDEFTKNKDSDGNFENNVWSWSLILLMVMGGIEFLRFTVLILYDLFPGMRSYDRVRNSRKAVGVDSEAGSGQRLPYANFLVAFLGVLGNMTTAFDTSMYSFWFLTALSLSIMIAEVSKIISRKQMESVINALLWVPFVYFILVQSVAYRGVGEKIKDAAGDHGAVFNAPIVAPYIVAVVAVVNAIYYSVMGYKEVISRRDGFTSVAAAVLILIPFGLIVAHHFYVWMFNAHDLSEYTGSNLSHGFKVYKENRDSLLTLDTITRTIWVLALIAYNASSNSDRDSRKALSLGPTSAGGHKSR